MCRRSLPVVELAEIGQKDSMQTYLQFENVPYTHALHDFATA